MDLNPCANRSAVTYLAEITGELDGFSVLLHVLLVVRGVPELPAQEGLCNVLRCFLLKSLLECEKEKLVMEV